MNALEQRARQILESAGFTVLRNGWPDFLAFREEGRWKKLAAFEIKSESDGLSDSQKIMQQLLRVAGIPVYVLRPSDLDKALKQKAKFTFDAGSLNVLRQETKDLRTEITVLMNKLEANERVLNGAVAVFDNDSILAHTEVEEISLSVSGAFNRENTTQS